MSVFKIHPGGSLQGTVQVPGDKSISHRSVMLGAIADGTTRVTGLLEGEDVLATIAAMRQMSVEIEGPEKGALVIRGVGIGGLNDPAEPLDMGNSGTAMRLLTGLLAGQGVVATLVGDESLSKRPMERIAKPLRQMGAVIDTNNGCPPIQVRTSPGTLVGQSFDLEIASAQLKSAILLAGLGAGGTTRVSEPGVTRDHTERMLNGFGYPVESGELEARLSGGGRLTATNLTVPADLSSAAFFIAAAASAPGSSLDLPNVGINPTRTGVIDILKLMGAEIRIKNERLVAGEPVADIHVGGNRLRGADIPARLVPLAIDEFPIICIAAANAMGTTKIRGARELRVKESDRIHAMATGLAQLGIQVHEVKDGLDITGGTFRGGQVDSFTDHRIAMSFAMAGLAAEEDITITRCENVKTSFPDFVGIARGAGLDIEELPA